MKSFFARHLYTFILTIVIIFATSLRFYQLGVIPVSLYWDEVAIGYNAYSILQTGKDEHGSSMPVLFQSFDDYKTPGYIYLTVFSIILFGLNEFSVRFFSAFLGVGTIFIVFLLVKELGNNKKQSWILALLSASILTISPWHIQFSRAGFEATGGLFFIVLGIFLLLKTIKNYSGKHLFFSLLAFVISCYFYRSFWVFTPFLLGSTFILYRNAFFSKHSWKRTSIVCLFSLIFLLPLGKEVMIHESTSRTNQVSIFTNAQLQLEDAAKKQQESGNTLISKIIHNRRLVYLRLFIDNYLLYFSPKFLVFEGDGNGRHSVLGIGLLYLWQVPFFLLGIIKIFKRKLRYGGFLLLWFFTAPVAAALTVPSPHALRSLQWVPILSILTAIGLYSLSEIQNRMYRYGIIAAIGIFVVISFNRYIYQYYVVTANAYSAEWGDGYKELVVYLEKNKKHYDKVYITGYYWQPYIYSLFYAKYPPEIFQKNGENNIIENYIYGGTSWDKSGKELDQINLLSIVNKKNLVVFSPKEFIKYKKYKKLIKIVHEIRNKNNKTVFILTEFTK